MTLNVNAALSADKYINKIADGGSQTLTFNIVKDGVTLVSNNSFIINYNITPFYYLLNDSNVSTYGSYGIVVSWDGSGTLDALLSQFGASYILQDYYENVLRTGLSGATGLTFTLVSGTATGISNGNIVGMNAGGSVTISVKSNGQQIGTIKVTMRRYYDLTTSSATGIDTYLSEGINVLPFTFANLALGSEGYGKNGWGVGITAIVSGQTTTEAITGGLNSLFSYNIVSHNASGIAPSLQYNATLGCYVIRQHKWDK